MQLQVGTNLQGGKYQIVNVLGQGSFGITYLANHTLLGKKVCIKEFFMDKLNSRGDDGSVTGITDGSLSHNYSQKFQKEAMNMAGADHANIVRVTDFFKENNTFYYVMDFIEGENLNDYIKYHPLTEQQALSIVKDVANALIYLHEQKHMLHLDLKPGNIMRRSSDGHIFLIDFGLSKHYSNNGKPETSTTIGLGTPGYAPIEQSNSARSGEFRPTIDIYALGGTLYKLLTRETPPQASDLVSDEDALLRVLSAHKVSLGVRNLIIKAMSPSYKNRYATVKDFCAAMDAVVNSSASSGNKVNEEKTAIIGSPQSSDKAKVNNVEPVKPATYSYQPDTVGSNNGGTWKRLSTTKKLIVIIGGAFTVFLGLFIIAMIYISSTYVGSTSYDDIEYDSMQPVEYPDTIIEEDSVEWAVAAEPEDSMEEYPY